MTASHPITDLFLVKKLDAIATLPTRGSAHAAGYDLFSAVDVVIPAEGQCAVSTKIAITTPMGTYGRIAPRSGLAAKHMIDVQAGIIDRDYTGEVVVRLINHSPTTEFRVSIGDRIAQLVLEKILTPDVTEVCELERGEGDATDWRAIPKYMLMNY